MSLHVPQYTANRRWKLDPAAEKLLTKLEGESARGQQAPPSLRAEPRLSRLALCLGCLNRDLFVSRNEGLSLSRMSVRSRLQI